MEVEEYQIPIRRGRRQRRRHWRIPPLALIVAAVVVCALIVWRLLSPPSPVPPMEEVDLPDWVTVKLLPVNEWSRPGTPLEAVNGVVVHYVGNPGTTAEQNNSYFRGLAESHDTYASSQFLIGLEGEVLLNVPLDEVAYCSNNRNDDTLSIECCHPGEDGSFTGATYDALVKLVRWLADTYDLKREDIIRHYDVTGKECPKYFVDHEDAWETFLDDVEQAPASGGAE
ncbi:MAG: N-acetylmuramoyl-L-alanine amidase [Oscillospiraceae bacterium]|nr:N-acetylmuramoyl-L-alanine amidase [Oscillospiraceae bacterium]